MSGLGWVGGRFARARSPLIRVEKHSLLGVAYGADYSGLLGEARDATYIGILPFFFIIFSSTSKAFVDMFAFCILAGGLRGGLGEMRLLVRWCDGEMQGMIDWV